MPIISEIPPASVGGSPTGAAGGDLSGTYPNPSVGTFAQTINALKYGVKADNSTDDTAAIQAALNAASTNPYGASNSNDYKGVIVQLPGGRMITSSALLMPANVTLQGQGASGSYLVNSAASGATIQLKTGTEVQTCIRDLGIIINSTAEGINIANVGQSDILGDTRHLVENVVVVGGVRAYYTSGGTENRIIDLMAYRQYPVINTGCIEVGSNDCMIERCTVAQPQFYDPGSTGKAGAGFRLATSNTRMVNCKAFGGSATGAQVQDSALLMVGFRNTIIGFEAQDWSGGNQSPTVATVQDGNGGNIYEGLILDSCSGGAFQSSPYSVVRGMIVVNRGGGTYTTPFAFDAGQCVIDAQLIAMAGSRITKDANSLNGSYGSNTLTINQASGYQSVAYAATVTPDPYLGGKVYLASITGALTLANPTTTYTAFSGQPFWLGQEITFMLPQDGTGGRVITFGAGYQTSGAISTTASSTTTITFRFDNTNWREVSRAVT